MARKASVFILGAVVMAVPFAIGVSNILNHFYDAGAYFQDAGQLAYLMSHPDPLLRSPQVFGEAIFWKYHVSVMIWLVAEISRIVPLTPAQYYAVYIGTGQALLAAGAFWALVGPVGLRGKYAVLAAILAIVFANSGLAIAILRYPHYEVLIAASIILMLLALHETRYKLAAVFLVLACLPREDGGFHAATFLAGIVIARRLLGLERTGERWMLGLLAAGMIYSIAALAWQNWAFPSDQVAFTSAYRGVHPFEHLGASMLLERLSGWLVIRSYIFLPLLVVAIWAILRRNAYLLVGYAATIPWLLLQLIAYSDLPGTLASYYAFPMLVASFWPLLGALKGERRATPDQRRDVLVGFTLMLAASFTMLPLQHNPNQIGFFDTFAPPPSLATQRAMDDAVSILARQDQLGNLVVDQGMLSLHPSSFVIEQTFIAPEQPGTDTIIYFVRGFQAREALARAHAAGLERHYAMIGTPIRIVTNKRLENLPDLAGRITAIPPSEP